ncbi:hypothetical protein F5Y07DRAFT_385019 [Xylaria sp. FL0933]|nr:hypothetical protein F5Y07DRAFT_385019 [Xylaria sp. FL0933]
MSTDDAREMSVGVALKMPTEDALKAKVEELEKIATRIAAKCNGTVPTKSALEAIARELLSIRVACDDAGNASVSFPNDYGSAELWSWYGYKIHLTQKAVNALNNVASVLESALAVATFTLPIISFAIPTTVGVIGLIAAALAVRAKVMYTIADGGDVDLYSVWPFVVALIPVSPSWVTEMFDDRMKLSAFRNNSWSDSKPFIGGSVTSTGTDPSVIAKSVPSFGKAMGRLFTVFNTSDRAIYYCYYYPKDDDPRWHAGFSDPYQIGEYGISPSLVEYGDELYMVFRNTHNQIWWCRRTAWGWENGRALHGGGANTADRVGLAKFNDKIYLVARGWGDESLWWSIYDSSGWSLYTRLNFTSVYGPALASFQGILHMVARGGGNDSRLWHYQYDGNHWESRGPLNHVYSNGSPSLAVFDNKLYCAAVGNEGDLWYMSYSQGSWSTYTQTGRSSGRGPTLCAYSDGYSDREEMIMCYSPAGRSAAGPPNSSPFPGDHGG